MNNCKLCEFIWNNIKILTIVCYVCKTSNLKPEQDSFEGPFSGIRHRNYSCQSPNCVSQMFVVCTETNLVEAANKAGWAEAFLQKQADKCPSCFEPNVRVTKMESDYIALACKYKHSFSHPSILSSLRQKIK